MLADSFGCPEFHSERTHRELVELDASCVDLLTNADGLFAQSGLGVGAAFAVQTLGASFNVVEAKGQLDIGLDRFASSWRFRFVLLAQTPRVAEDGLDLEVGVLFFHGIDDARVSSSDVFLGMHEGSQRSILLKDRWYNFPAGKVLQ